MGHLPISVIILTYNEEKNLPDCLASLQGLAEEIFVVDSGSTDRTPEIARAAGAIVLEHPFENYGRQRNWALDNLPLRCEWTLQLDADHRVTAELQVSLRQLFNPLPPGDVNGYMVSRRTMFLGKWIRHGGHYPVYHAVLFRRQSGRCEDKLYDQHFVVQGTVRKLRGDIIDVITDSLSTFTERHNRWSSLEAAEQPGATDQTDAPRIQPRIAGTPMEQRRFLKSAYERWPLFVRPFLYFLVRYFFRLGFLDGRRGLIFHFLQGFWFRFLIDAKIFEQRYRNNPATHENRPG
ncbi:MAG: glycosyltransferase family 2 protein [Thermoanaerobaculia bacterium]|nr:glycosyltransferase family 2 protein [Thermoanaerobaculia bacterium]